MTQPFLVGFKIVHDFVDPSRFVLCRLLVPANEVTRTYASRCHAPRVFVREVDGMVGVSIWDPMTLYIDGSWVASPDGIHFFTDEQEARACLADLSAGVPVSGGLAQEIAHAA